MMIHCQHFSLRYGASVSASQLDMFQIKRHDALGMQPCWPRMPRSLCRAALTSRRAIRAALEVVTIAAVGVRIIRPIPSAQDVTHRPLVHRHAMEEVASACTKMGWVASCAGMIHQSQPHLHPQLRLRLQPQLHPQFHPHLVAQVEVFPTASKRAHQGQWKISRCASKSARIDVTACQNCPCHGSHLLRPLQHAQVVHRRSA